MVLGMPVRCTQNSRMGRESRTPGALPPLDRVLKAPVERVALGLMGSKAMMDLAGRFMKSDA
jgi:2,4-dienoyl-CoA reductase (NADPH2)